MGQQIAAAGAAHALDQAAAAQFGKQLLEIRERDFLPLGDFGKRDRVAVAVPGEIDHRHYRIAAFGAEPHGCAPATRRRAGRDAGVGASPAAGASFSRSSSPTRARSVETSSSSPFNARAIGSGISPLTPYGSNSGRVSPAAARPAWRAGLPTIVAPSGTSRSTTAAAPMRAPSPTRIGPSTCAPEP